MKRNFILPFLLGLAACSQPNADSSKSINVAGQTDIAAAAQKTSEMSSKNFITVDGVRLMDGDEEFRFISFNVPTLLYVEDEMAFEETNPYGLPTEYELRDLYESVNQLGGRVVRAYTIPVRNKNFPAEAVTYVEEPGQFNEEAFRAMDMAIALAADFDIRLIIPLVNNWQWMGGRPNYADFRGMTNDDFCTDPQLRADFKKTIEFVLTRTNTITGTPYNEDPTVMAWETGNEMTCPGEWAVDVAETIKSYAPKQLVIDGWHAVHVPKAREKDFADFGEETIAVDAAANSIGDLSQTVYEPFVRDFPQEHSFESDAIDLVSTHHYEEDPIAMLDHLKKTVELADGRKPIFVGEFSFMSTTGMEDVMDYIISEPGIPGGLAWSLRRHHRDGGWYYHTEPLGAGIFRAYHWPGFDNGEVYDERNFLNMLRRKAFEIQGKPVPPITAPAAPQTLPITSPGALRWRGSAGAAMYEIQRAASADGPWEQIAGGIDDMATPGFPLHSDETAKVGETYYYRFIAINAGGASAPSAPVGPVAVSHLTRVDTAKNFGVMTRSVGVEVRTSDWRSYKEANSRLHGEIGSEVIYNTPGDIKAFRAYVFEPEAEPAMILLRSVDGENWTRLEPQVDSYISAERNYDYLVPHAYSVTEQMLDGAAYVRIVFANSADIVRVEMDYRP